MAALERALGPGTKVALHAETGAVRFIGTAPGKPIARPDRAPASAPARAGAEAFLAEYGDELGIEDPARELDLVSSERATAKRRSLRYRQLHRGVPVLGGELVLNLDRRGDLLSASGEALPSPGIDVSPRVEPAAAVDAALAGTAREHAIPAGALEASQPKLSVYDSRLLGGPGLDRPRLVWRTEVTARDGSPVRELVLVDAELGSVALALDQIAEAKVREVCDANGTKSEYPCTAGLSDRSEGDPVSAVQDVNDAFDYSGDTYDFFFSRFNRDSLDGAGMTLFSTVRFCPSPIECPFANAFWDGEQMVFGEGFAAADDVVAHELTHGITDFESRLFYYYQSGAINESLSDVFGELVDLTNAAGSDTAADRWLLGEDLAGVGALRDMEDPPAFNDPDRITSNLYTADAGEQDAGGVHTNSGVNNKAAFLIADGGVFNGRTVTGLGVEKAARVYYEVATNLLTSASDYRDLYLALQQACANLVGTGGITSADCQEVKDAAFAVEMNLTPPAAPNPEAEKCPTGQVPSQPLVFEDDLENTASGNWQKTTADPPSAWFYPQNPNTVGLDATFATSGETNFWGYNQSLTSDSAIGMASSVPLPAGAFLHFRHAYGFEDSSSSAFDGGVLEYSTNSGASWSDAGGLATVNGYNGTLTGSGTNPLAGRQAFVRESNGYVSSRVDLAALAGQSVRFRFRLGTDGIVDDYGWFIDDISIHACEPAPSQPALSISDASVAEGDSGQAGAAFVVSLSSSSSEVVTVEFTTANGTAGAGSDYVQRSDTLTFQPGDVSESAVVTVNGDTQIEPDETFAVSLSEPVNAAIADSQATGTIADDDSEPPPPPQPSDPAAPPPSDVTQGVTDDGECADAREDLERAKRKLRRAKRKLLQADTKVEERRAERRVKKAKRRVRRARRAVAAVCA